MNLFGKKPSRLTITCNGNKKRRPRLTPSFGVLEIPPGCAANTDEWVLPASFQSASTLQSGNRLLVNFSIPTFSRELSVHLVQPEIDNKPRALDELQSI